MATRYRLLLLTGACLVLAANPAAAQRSAPGDTFALADVYALAAAHNPMLAATRARAEAVESLESSAALPPDPQLQVGVMNASLPGLQTGMPTSMAPAVQLMQMVPLPGKLGLAGEIARKETAIARSGSEETAWMVRARAAMAFYEIYDADRRLETMRGTLRLLEDFEQVARAMYASGEGRQADVLRASVEIARMRAEIERMNATRIGSVSRLNAVLGRPADTQVLAVAYPDLPDRLPDQAELRSRAREDRPLLRQADLGVQQAEARTALARRELWPDLSVGVQYGQRAAEMGTERMGSLMVGIGLPVFARKRQLKMRDEAAAMERMVTAEAADARAQVDARIGELLAGLDRARTLRALYRAEVLPQADAAVQSAFSSYRVGAVDFMTLVEAQMSRNEYQQEIYGLEAEYGQLLAELEATIGRELTGTSPVATEE